MGFFGTDSGLGVYMNIFEMFLIAPWGQNIAKISVIDLTLEAILEFNKLGYRLELIGVM